MQPALFAQAAVQPQLEGRLAQAVELLYIHIQRADQQLDVLLGQAVGEVQPIAAQLAVLQQHLPGLAGIAVGHVLVGRGCVAGQQCLPVDPAIGFAAGPGFEMGTA
ncbi:hypothetical protein D3C77_676040 [compost metagenome]